jgi:hypothetical protein
MCEVIESKSSRRLSSQDLLQLTIVMGAVDINDSKKVIRHVKSVIRHRQFDNRKLVRIIYFLIIV